MPQDEMVIFVRTYALLDWLTTRAERFPTSQRHLLTARLLNAAFDAAEALHDANSATGEIRLARLREADAHLNKLRMYLRLAHEKGWLSAGQYQHVSALVAEIGRLLGGWIKQTEGGRT